MPTEMTILAIFQGAIFSNENLYLLVTILIALIIGAMSRSLAIATFSGLLILIHVSLRTDLWIFDALLYLIVGISLLIMSFRAYGYVKGSKGGGVEPAGGEA